MDIADRIEMDTSANATDETEELTLSTQRAKDTTNR